MQKVKVPKPQIVYGRIIYWLCIISALICTIGSVLAITFPDLNVMNPQFLFSSIWSGNSAEVVWQQVAGRFPGGHFWLHSLNRCDGYIHLGLVIGCCCSFFALLGSSIAYFQEKPRRYGWALLSIIIALQILFSTLGIYRV
ncbi:hypothetical protein ES703_111261 [subsurface metagenome]